MKTRAGSGRPDAVRILMVATLLTAVLLTGVVAPVAAAPSGGAWAKLLPQALYDLLAAGSSAVAQNPGVILPDTPIAPVEPPIQLPPREVGAQLVESTTLMRAAQARTTYGVTGSGLTAAVFDTGLRTTHVDFTGRVLTGRNYSSDDGGNPAIYEDYNGHGTNVAGIICAASEHMGIAPGANVIPLKVLNSAGSGSFAGIRDALQWVIDNRATYNITVCNLSLGDPENWVNTPDDSAVGIRQRIQTLREMRVPVVISAGNNFFSHSSQQGMGYPAIVPESVSVGAVYDASMGGFEYGSGAIAYTTGSDRITPFSQRLHETLHPTNRTDAFAPGAALTSSGIDSDWSSSIMHGTSQAAPALSGLILLMQQAHLNQHGVLPRVRQIEDWLRWGSVEINDGDDEDDNVTNTGLNFLRSDAVDAVGLSAQPPVAYDEDFATGNLSKWNWNTGGHAQWAVTSATSHSGSYSAKAGNIGHGQTSFIEITSYFKDGEVSFHKQISSELGGDYLVFSIDGAEQERWSGGGVDGEWSTAPHTYLVAEGTRTLRWEYTKNASVSHFADTAWIDGIIFPAVEPPTQPVEVVIAPEDPVTGDNLTATASGSVSSGPDEVTYQYQWSASDDGTTWSPWGHTGATLNSSNTTKGQHWKARARATTDGNYFSDWTESAPVTIGNTAPSAPATVTIVPASPVTADDLTASASGSTDPDPGDSVSYEYQWSSSDDGTTWSDWGDDGGTISSADTQKGQQWKARARASDGEDYSNWTESSPVTIGNTPPSAPTTVTIDPGSPVTADDLTASASGSTDPDPGDTIDYEYQWSSSSDGTTWSAWGHPGETLSSAHTAKGQHWKARARASDGEGVSGWTESDPVIIGNTPPSTPTTVEIAPDSPVTADDLTASASGSTDPDSSDTIDYEYQWSSSDDGTTWSDWGHDGETLSSHHTEKGQHWKARARASDGDDVSGWTESDPVIIGNTPPSVPTSVVIDPEKPENDDDLTATASGSTDPDPGDSVSYEYQWSSSADGTTWSDWGHDGETLLSGNTSPNDLWKARARATDGATFSEWTESAAVPVHGVKITAGPDGSPNPVYSEQEVECSVAAVDSHGHDLNYAWTAEGNAGDFDDPAAQNPTWTAPANNTQDVLEYEITVTVTCAEDGSLLDTASYTQRVSPVHEVRITAGPSGAPNPVYSEEQVQCSVTAEDTLVAHELLYEWSAEGGAGEFDDATAQNPIWTAPANNTQDVVEYEITVTVTCAEDATRTATTFYQQLVDPVHEVHIVEGPGGDPNPVESGEDVQCSVIAEDTLGHELIYEWIAQDGAGSFDDSTLPNPVWSAPANETDAVVEYEITVTVTCTEDATRTETESYIQRVNPVHEIRITEAPSGDPSPVESAGSVACSVTAIDTYGHDLIYSWSAEGNAGSFDDPSAQNPTWHAPPNKSGVVREYEISVTVTCADNPAVRATASYTQQVSPVHEVRITRSPSGDPNPVESGGTVACSVEALDTHGHELRYEWTAEGDAGTFDDPTLPNPTWTAPANTGSEVQTYEITVTVTCADDAGVTATASYVQSVNPVHEITIIEGPSGDQPPVASGGAVALHVLAEDNLGHDLLYLWTSEGDAGSFDNAASRTPVWTAPVNDTHTPQQFTITVTVTCSVDPAVSATAAYRQQVDPHHEIVVTQAASGDPASVAAGGAVQCSVDCEDSLGHELLFAWWAQDDAGSFDDPNAQNPTWTAPPNNTAEVQEYEISVTITCADDASESVTSSYVQRVEPIHEITIADGPAGDPNPVGAETRVELSVTALDSLGHALNYSWSAEDESGEAVGSFENPQAAQAVWRAPATDSPMVCTITVVITCASDPSVRATGSFEQQVMPRLSRIFAPGPQMVSLPLAPTRVCSLRELFGAERVALWNAAEQDYAGDSVQQWPAGTALWALFSRGAHRHATMSGALLAETAFEIDARRGWNLVGVPWNRDLPISALGAEGDGQFRRIAWTYYDGRYHLVTDIADIPGSGSLLEAWRGYWVSVSEDCRLNLTSDAAAGQVQPQRLIGSDGDGWLVQLVASTALSEDIHNYCGVRSGEHPLLIPNPPLVEGGISLFFTPAEDTRSALALSPATADAAYQWDFSVTGAAAGQEVALSWPDLSSVPAGHGVYLRDRDTDRLLYLRTRASYSYTAGDEGERRFTLIVRPRSEAPLTVSAVEARQSSAGVASVQFILSADANVEVEVMNIAGRPVRQLVSGSAMAAGLNSLEWNLRSGDGTAIPSGLYLVQVRASAEDGAQVRSLATLKVAR